MHPTLMHLAHANVIQAERSTPRRRRFPRFAR
jgi:hypothetical protein